MIVVGHTIPMTKDDIIFACTEDEDRTVEVRVCNNGEGFVIRFSNGPGNYKYVGLLRDTSERLFACLEKALMESL